jgi:cytochrome P450
LKEILRLEPMASMIYRRTTDVVTDVMPGPIPAGTRLTLDIRAANLDEAHVGACPHALDPDRAKRLKGVNDFYLSFGTGEHLCPGRNVALSEARVFLDRLLRVPGIRLVRAPDIHFSAAAGTYELRNCMIACDRARRLAGAVDRRA